MNVTEFTQLLQHPDKVVSPVQTKQLEDILVEYPYFQAARAIHLKGLKNLNSYKYNSALKITAAYIADRDILFDFITSKEFLQNQIADTISGKSHPLSETEIISEEVPPTSKINTFMDESSEDEPLPRTSKDADNILNPKLFESKDPEMDKSIAAKKKAQEELELGKPLSFTKKEKYSFAEWLQLTSVKTVDRNPKNTGFGKDQEKPIIDIKSNQAASKRKKFDLIDRFIETNPKIVPQDQTTVKVDIKESLKMDNDELMTETLAKVYLEQKKYKKAIQAYRILSLKYPEKSGFFADRIKAVKKLKEENA
ncbi:hypothetical protein K8352_18170 [Flavobacteriaceae bacterium F89]|uniref:Tetratricopeptide repeat protein n=1 Tax=Cerina litoralis TaxID=2874477 RepID=A0AAE3EYH8_9FLAO|nr:hypothetical protein [Cerina litoralis]MCG2462694.1 hypothetical protein [Cerina litoralis]